MESSKGLWEGIFQDDGICVLYIPRDSRCCESVLYVCVLCVCVSMSVDGILCLSHVSMLGSHNALSTTPSNRTSKIVNASDYVSVMHAM